MSDEISCSEKLNDSALALEGIDTASKKKILQNISTLIELLDLMSEEQLFNHYGEMTFLKQALTAVETVNCPENRAKKLYRIEERISKLKDIVLDNDNNNEGILTEENSNKRK